MSAGATLAPPMANHPNRGRGRGMRSAANPTPAQIKAAREKAGLTQAAAAELVHTTWHTWQKWETPAADANNRRMLPAIWELFQVKLAARQMLADRELSPAHVRGLGLHLPV